MPRFCIFHPYQVPTAFLYSDASYHALTVHFFKGRREQICFKFFSEYEIKQSSTWKELIAIQFAPRPSASNVYKINKTSYIKVIRPTGSFDLLGTQNRKTSKNIQKSKHSRGTFLTLSFILAFF